MIANRQPARGTITAPTDKLTMTRPKPQDSASLGPALLAIALKNIRQRRANERREAVHDALLVFGLALSTALTITGALAWWLLVRGHF